MELPNQEGEMPIPLNSTYGGGHGHTHAHAHVHMIHHPSHNHIIPSSNGILTSSTTIDHDHVPHPKKSVKYRECLKNHAAAMGGSATDGCGEFMPSGQEGSMEALTCSACNCHRNFHRKEIDGEPSSLDSFYPRMGRKLYLGHNHKGYFGQEAIGYHTTGALISSRAPPVAPHQMLMSYNMGSLPSDSDEQEDAVPTACGGGAVSRPPHLVRKRFRTKFTAEQKEKMLSFAEKVGWKIQKQEEAVVQQFCQEVGVKRRVLKVWMHNNKHNLAKRNTINQQPSVNPTQIQV